MILGGDAAWRVRAGMLAVVRRLVSAFIISASLAGSALASSEILGAFGPEGPRMREQLWLIPSGDPKLPLRATVFRPEESSAGTVWRRTLVVINHGTDEMTRLSVAMPVYYWLSRWFVERGYVVVVPQRRGHGATGGELAEAVGTCETADHFSSGQIAADDIAATINYMIEQPFVAPRNAIVVGISTGGWASLALAARNLPSVASIVNFAGGRGGHAYGRANAICNYQGLLAAARQFGKTARQPSIWLYSENDTYFAPEVARALAREWQDGGGNAQVHIFAAQTEDGHAIADDRADWDLWGDALKDFIDRHQNDLEATEVNAAAMDHPQTARPVSLPTGSIDIVRNANEPAR